jgi:hypothetical protein
VLAVFAIVPATVAAMPAVPRAVFGTFASRYLSAIFTGLWSSKPWDFTVGLSTILFVCGYWLGWMSLRECRGVLAVVPMYAVLAVNVINAPRPDDVALPVTLAIALSLAVIAASYLGSLSARWAPARITPLESLRWPFARTAAPVAAGLTLVALLLPAVSTTNLSARLFSQGVGTGASNPSGSGSGSDGTATIGFNAAVDLGGPLDSEPKPVLTYTTDTGASAYLQVTNDTDFDRGNWYAPARGASIAGGDTWGGVSFSSGPLPRDTSPADGGIGIDEEPINAEIVVDEGATGDEELVPFTGEPDAVDFPGTAFGAINNAHQNQLLTVDSVLLNGSQPGDTTTLQTIALVSTATAAQLSTAGTNYPAWTSQYTELNDDFTQGVETIHSLAERWTAGFTDPYDQAIAIESHLRDPAYFQYTLDPPGDPNPDVWPLVFFLTTSHRGYCQYFASAMGAMLRSLGIPTRLESGYGPGSPEGAGGIRPRATLGEQVVTTSDAHTWVEAYFPDYGWIPFEPTPASGQGDYEPFARGSAAIAASVAPHATPAPKSGLSTPAPAVASTTPPTRGALPAAVQVALSTLSGIVGLVVLALLWFTLPRSVTGAWRRVETLGMIVGLERQNAETHHAFALRLGRLKPRAGPAFSELAALTGRAEFSATGTSVTDRLLARRTWRRALFAALPRRIHRTASR